MKTVVERLPFFPPRASRRVRGRGSRFRLFAGAVLLCLSFLAGGCTNHPHFEFEQDIQPGDIQLFALLDDYPILKSLFTNSHPGTFNEKLAEGMAEHRQTMIDVLPALGDLMTHPDGHLQKTMAVSARIMKRMRELGVYEILDRLFLQNGFETDILGTLREILNDSLEDTEPYQMEADVAGVIGDLKDPELKTTIRDVQEIVVKALHKNEEIPENLLLMWDGIGEFLGAKPKNRETVIALLRELGRTFEITSDNTNLKIGEVLQKLLINLARYFDDTGDMYLTNHSAELKDYLFTEVEPGIPALFESVKKLLQPGIMKDPEAIPVEEFVRYLARTGLDPHTPSSLAKMLRYNINYETRTPDNSGIHLLEFGMYSFALGDIYGFELNTDGDIVNTTGQPGNGYLTIGDTIVAMGSDPGFAFPPLNNNNNFRRNGEPNPINPQMNGLLLMEGESRGVLDESWGPNHDTAPNRWVLGHMVLAALKGYGPYYNKNKRDENGNYLTPDGTVYMDAQGGGQRYKPTWYTDYHCYNATDASNVFLPDVSLGFFSNDCDTTLGGRLTIQEMIQASWDDPLRRCETDEEAILKNIWWFMFEKRMVTISPVVAPAGAPVVGNFSTNIGNGLMGAGSLQLYSSSHLDNGRWLKSGEFIKGAWDATGGLDNWSNVPGDSVMHFEVFKMTYPVTFDFAGASISIFPNLGTGHSNPLILGVSSQVFPTYAMLKNLGAVHSWDLDGHWEKRNTMLTPLLALFGSFFDNTDTTAGKVPFRDLNLLMEAFALPRIYTVDSPVQHLKPRVVGPADWRASDQGGGNSVAQMQPDDSIVTLFTLLSESTPRQNDGLLFLFTKTDLINYLLELLLELGKPAYDNPEGYDPADPWTFGPRRKLFHGLAGMLDEFRLSGEVTDPESQYDFQKMMTDFQDDLPEYLGRYSNYQHSDWESMRDFFELAERFLGPNSEDSLQETLAEFLRDESLNLKAAEKRKLLEALIVLVYNKTTEEYTTELQTIAGDHLPPMLETLQGHFHAMMSMGNSLMAEDGFIEYLVSRAHPEIAPSGFLGELEVFLNSDLMQNHESPDSFWKQSATLMDDFRYMLINSKTGSTLFEDGSYISDSTARANGAGEEESTEDSTGSSGQKNKPNPFQAWGVLFGK